MYNNIKDLLIESEKKNCSIASLVMENEKNISGMSEEEIYNQLRKRMEVMKKSAEKALNEPQNMFGNLISGQAQKQHLYKSKEGFLGPALNRMMAQALSCCEVNASMGRICAAPTAGSCGILPAVLFYGSTQMGSEEKEILDALLVASGIGAVVTRNATVSGAEGGCQAECGTAAAMAAAALVTLAGGTAEQVAESISIALINCMGLVCDPIAGLVQLPCSFRNASQAMNAVSSADLALAGQRAMIPADEVIDAMYRVGRMMPPQLRETSQGGIATAPTALEMNHIFSLLSL